MDICANFDLHVNAPLFACRQKQKRKEENKPTHTHTLACVSKISQEKKNTNENFKTRHVSFILAWAFPPPCPISTNHYRQRQGVFWCYLLLVGITQTYTIIVMFAIVLFVFWIRTFTIGEVAVSVKAGIGYVLFNIMCNIFFKGWFYYTFLR